MQSKSIKRTVSILLILSLAVFSASCTPEHAKSAGAFGLVGGVAGALLDKENPWRGGVIGAGLGAALGATLAEISAKGAEEAAQTGQPVEYRTRTGEGTAVYRAEPVEYDAQTKCHKVRERIWENGELVREDIKEVCESEKTEPGYFGEQAEGADTREYERPEDRYAQPPPPPGYEYERERDEDYYYGRDRGGPPPWAPAHGYRAKYRYRYYPDSYVYYNEDRDIYYYRYAGRWVESPMLPANIYLDADYVTLEMDAEEPYDYHRDVVKKYPPGYKKKPKSNWKYY